MVGEATSGYRALLFSDLRGYTAFVEARGDAQAAGLLQRYRVVVRDVIAQFAGAEIRTEGDSFYVVFGSASSAVRAGLAIVVAAHDATLREPEYPIEVGIGIHAGETTDTTEGPVGSAVNIAARLCSQARAGEVLVSETVRGLVRTSIPVTFVSRGRRQLKGVREPMTVYAPIAEGAARPGVLTHPVAVGGLARGQRSLLALGAVGLVAVVALVMVFRPGSSGAAGAGPTDAASGAVAARSQEPSPSSAPATPAPSTAASAPPPIASLAIAPSPSPTPNPSVFPNDAEQALLDHVPPSIAPDCLRATAETGGLGGQASLRCELLAQDADTVWYDGFVTRATAGERFDRLVRDAHVPNGTCGTKVGSAVGSWSLGSGVAGQLLCYSDGRVAWLVWTYDDQPIIGQASRADGDAAALFTWWKGVGPFLR